MRIFGITVKPLKNTIKAFGKDNYQGVRFNISLGKDKGYATVFWGNAKDPAKIQARFPTINMIDTNKKYYIPVADMYLTTYAKQDGTLGTSLTITTNYVDYVNPQEYKEWGGTVKTTGLNEFDKLGGGDEPIYENDPLDTSDFFETNEKDDDFNF